MTAETSNARGEWVLVPRNPTEAMIDAWRDAPDIWEDAYTAMLAAAPQPPSAPVGVEGFEQWYARVDARFWNNWDACNAAFHAGKRAALAQQPAAVDEVVEPATAPDVARLVEAARNLRRRQRAYLEQPKGERDESKGRLVGDAARELDEALAPFTVSLTAEGEQPEGSRSVTNQLLHWGGIPVRVTGTVTTSPGNWPLIDAALAAQRQEPTT